MCVIVRAVLEMEHLYVLHATAKLFYVLKNMLIKIAYFSKLYNFRTLFQVQRVSLSHVHACHVITAYRKLRNMMLG
jgi:hypothetical protein